METPRVPFRNQVQPDPKLDELAQKRAAAEAKKIRLEAAKARMREARRIRQREKLRLKQIARSEKERMQILCKNRIAHYRARARMQLSIEVSRKMQEITKEKRIRKMVKKNMRSRLENPDFVDVVEPSDVELNSKFVEGFKKPEDELKIATLEIIQIDE